MDSKITEIQNKLKSPTCVQDVVDTIDEIQTMVYEAEESLKRLNRLEALATTVRDSFCDHDWQWVHSYDDKYRYCTRCHAEAM